MSGDNTQIIHIGERIKQWREDMGWSQWALAQSSGVKRASISTYERGDYYPSAQSLIRLAIAFNTTVDELIAGTDMEDGYW